MIDLYAILPEEWFEQIGGFSTDQHENEPSNYENVCTSMYFPNVPFAGEIVNLVVNADVRTYYLRSITKQPIGDYAWGTVFSWYQSDPSRYDEIESIIEMAMKEDKKP